MARNQISSIAFGQVNSVVRVLPGASVTVTSASGAPVTLYASEDGAETVGNPFTCDEQGRYAFFVTAGEESYTITVILGPVSYSWEFYPPDNTAAAGLIYEETWADLVGRTTNLDGAAAEVTNDTGTHLAATETGYDGGEVANQGRYRWNAAWARWQRLPDLKQLPYSRSYDSIEDLEADIADGYDLLEGQVAHVGGLPIERKDGFSIPGLATAFRPAGGRLHIRQCGTESELAADFAGIFRQALSDCSANSWQMVVDAGDWETEQTGFDASAAGSLDIEFMHGAKLIGPPNFQHFSGDGSTKVFALTAWASADTDIVTAMVVDAANGYTILTSGDATNGFTKSGTTVTLGSAVAAPAVGETLVISANSSILKITGENGDLRLRIRGGHFDNGQMGYVEAQAAGTCVDFTSIRNLYWDGGPIFENSSQQSWDAASLLDIRGDSGLVLGNVERASIYGAQFLYQPDAGNYTTGLARGTPPEDYHVDDGRFVNFYGSTAYRCGLGFRSARDGGGYGLYGCGVDMCGNGHLSANVSSNMPAARNVIIHGFTARKTGYKVLDLRETRSADVSGLMIEDHGRKPDGSEVDAYTPAISLAEVRSLNLRGARVRFEEWDVHSSATRMVEISNGQSSDMQLDLSLEAPFNAIGSGLEGVWISGGIGGTGDIAMNLRTTNVDTPLPALTGVSADTLRASIIEKTDNFSGTVTKSYYRYGNGITVPETTQIPGESVGTFAPDLLIGTLNDLSVTENVSNAGFYIRKGNLVSVFMSARFDLSYGASAATGFARISISDAGIPDIGEIVSQDLTFWNPTNPQETHFGLTTLAEMKVAKAGGQALTIYGHEDITTRAALTADMIEAAAPSFFRADIALSYITADSLS